MAALGQTYTPAAGSTPQASQLGDLQSSLNSITSGLSNTANNVQQMTANRPAQLAQVSTNLQNAYQVPQATQTQNDIQSLYQMYINDLGMSGKLSNQMATQPGDVVTSPGAYNGSQAVPGSAAPPNAATPYMTNTLPNPGLVTSAMKSDTDSMVNLLDAISGYIGTAYSGVKSGITANDAAYRDTLNAQLGLAQNYMDMYKTVRSLGLTQEQAQTLALEQRKQDLAEWQAGYPGSDPTNPSSNPASPLNLAGKTKAQVRDLFQQEIDNTPSLQRKQELEAVAKGYGIDLTIKPPSSVENGQLQKTGLLINQLTEAKKLLDDPNTNLDILPGISGAGAIGGNIIKGMVGQNLQGAIPNANLKRLVQIFTTLVGTGERSIIGGRLTGYLTDTFRPAFPNLTWDRPTLQNMVNLMLESAKDDVSDYADVNGYYDPTKVPYVGRYYTAADQLFNQGNQGGTQGGTDTRPPLSSFQQ